MQMQVRRAGGGCERGRLCARVRAMSKERLFPRVYKYCGYHTRYIDTPAYDITLHKRGFPTIFHQLTDIGCPVS